MRYLYTLLIVLCLLTPSFSHDYLPGESQDQPILLKGGDLYTMSDGLKENTDLLIIDGIIKKIGKDIVPPDNCKVIDVTGKNVYPGLIAPNSFLGLVEIGGSVPGSVDRTEIGKNNAAVMSYVAYNTDSEIIPTVRSNGITTALVVPNGSLIMGRSSLINLDGWNFEDALFKKNVGLHINWPRMSVAKGWWVTKSPEEQMKDNNENIKEIGEIFEAAISYMKAINAHQEIEYNINLEAMIPALTQQMPVFIHANNQRQIESAIAFSVKYHLRMILVGGADSWKMTELLKRYNIPVILTRTQALPSREDESYDMRYKLPALLAQDSVDFCLSYGSYTGTRNLPFMAGQAVAYGLDKSEALKSITWKTASILGVDDKIGALKPYLKANIIVVDGDILDHKTSHVLYEFIDGKEVDLNSKNKELYEKYRQK